MKSVLRYAAIAASSLALLATTVTPSEAVAKASFDVTSLSAKDLVVSDTSCVKTDVTMKHTKKNVESWYVDTNVYGRKGISTWASFSEYSNRSKDRVQVCPSWDGLGKYTLGPSEIMAFNSDWQSDDLERADQTKGSFYVRGKATASLSAKRKGSTVTLSVVARRYSPEDYDWLRNNTKAKFQVKSGSQWKTLKTVTLKKGTGSYTVKNKGAKQYRVVLDKTSIAASSTSKVIKK